MKKMYSMPFNVVFFLFISIVELAAQTNNLNVAFKDAASAPRNLNVCGDEATVTMTVSTEGVLSTTRRNILSTLTLFKGVQFVRFNATGTTSGVSLVSSNTSGATFSLPDLTPGSSSAQVNISYVIRVNCQYTDTLSHNDLLDVKDQWDFNYNMGTNSGLTETDFSTPYRDQIKVPYFTMSVSNNAIAARVGQSFQRTIYINNSGLDGYIKGFEYSNSQGAGIYIKKITINGQPLTVTRTPPLSFGGDTILTVNVPASLFQFNTRGPITPANGNLLFEPDETVTVVEDFCVVNCDKSRISMHSMSWGCDARFCNVVSKQDIIRLGDGQVNVGFTGQGSIADLTGGYCSTGRSTVRFTNNGIEVDPGTAGMYDLEVGVGLGDLVALRDKGYHITKITVAGQVIPTPSVALADLRNNLLFTSDPDGLNNGLTDLDGDGFFDDLPVGNSVEVTVEYEVECSTSLSNRNDNCKNDFETAFNAQINYTDLCGKRNQVIKPRYFGPLNANDLVENCSDPDTRTDQKPFSIQHLERRNVFNFDRNCGGQEEILVKVKVPNGILTIKDSMYMLHFTDTLFLKRMTLSNDTVFLAFRADSAKQKGSGFGEMISVDYLNGDYKVNFGFKATCSALPGPTNFPMELAYSCPPCGCQHVWYCDTLAGPRIHYAAPPCAPNLAYECPKGLKTTSFSAIRTTLGYTDPAYTNKIAPSAANLKVAMSCDSVRMTVLNVVGNTPISDSIGVRISYDNITNTALTHLNDIFQYGKGFVKFVKNGQTYSCVVDVSKAHVVRLDSSKYIYIDLNSCLTSLNIGPLSKGDSVNFYGDFSVFTDGPYKNTFEKMPQFRAYGYYTDGGQEFACDNYGETFRVGKSQSVFSYPNSSNYPKGCAEASLEYKIIMINNAYYDFFGGEYRQSVGVDSFTVQFDPEFIRAFATQVEVSIPDHPYFGNNFYPLSNINGTGKYVARFDTLHVVPSLNRVTSYAFNLRIKATPNCRSLTGSGLNSNVFQFNPKIFFRDRYYALEIGDGTCAPYRRDSVPNGNIVYSDPPALTFVPTTNPSTTTINDTAKWTVKLCNTSDKGNAGISWVSIEPILETQKIRVVSMRDITNNANPFDLTFSSYGTNSNKFFAYTNPLDRATPDKNLDDICNIVEIKAVIGDCGESQVAINSGWNCLKPTDPQWNPSLYPPCTDLTIQGGVTTQAPFLDANFINQSLTKPGICDSTVLEILLRNTDLGKAFNIKTQITLPLLGATFIPSQVQVAYPPSAPYHNVLGVPTVVGSNQLGRVFQYDDFSKLDSYLHQNGLNGFDANHPNDSNEVKIRFSFANDCDFKSGSLVYFSFIGKSSCGTPSNSETGESLPIQIQGAELTSPKLYSVSSNPTNHFVPAGETEIEVGFTNLTTTPSDYADEFTVKLPSGITYHPNSVVAIQPASWLPGEPKVRTVGDVQMLTWYQPPGLQLNEKGTLRFTVSTPDTLTCNGGTRSMSLVTMAEKQLVCSSTQSFCRIEIITTSNGEQFASIPLSTDTIKIRSILPIRNGVIYAKRGDIVQLTAGGSSVRWIDQSNNNVLGTQLNLNFTPVRSQTSIRVEAVSGNCLAPSRIAILTELDTTSLTIAVRDTTVSCRDSFPLVLPIITGSSDPNPSVTYSDQIDALQPCGERLTRTWLVTDASGKTSSAKQIITRIDRTPPVITLRNPNLIALNFHSGDTLIVDCQHIPFFNVFDMNMVDDCDNDLTKSFVDLPRRSGHCPQDGYIALLECEWKAVDKCNNTTVFKIFVKILDNDIPRLVNVPVDITVSNINNVPLKPTNVYGQDNCDDDVAIQFSEVNNGSSITRSWLATDDCGHAAMGTQHITIAGGNLSSDTVPPTYQFNNYFLQNMRRSSDTIVYNGCDYNFKASDISVTDNRDRSPRVSFDSTIVKGNCSVDGFLALKNYTWVATDSSGNFSIFVVNLRIVDSTAPILNGIPSDVTLTSNDPAPQEPNVTATDDCGSASVNLSVLKKIVNNDTILTRVWTATDACGNTATGQQNITRRGSTNIPRDTTPPQYKPIDPLLLGTKSGDTTVSAVCNASFLYQNSVSIFDNKDANPSVQFDSLVKVGICQTDGYLAIKTYTWMAKDNSGNTSSFKANLRVIDNTPPFILGVPPDVTINATDALPLANVTTVDDCTVPTLSQDLTVIQNGNDTLFVRKWTSVDECGNTTILRQNTYKRGPASKNNTGTLVGNLTLQITEGQLDTICFIGTNPDSLYTITNFCPNATAATFTPINNNSCLVIKGITVGSAKACFRVCNSSNRCDTTLMTVSVVPQVVPIVDKPKLIEDYALTQTNKILQIPVYQNDSVKGKIKSFSIKYDPKNGVATTIQIQNEYYVVYAPQLDYCSSVSQDALTYEVCNEAGCSQTMVFIRVLCDSMIVRNGFSPNADGVNDLFIIEGIDNYPHTQVSVFNRWGERVYFSKDYKNDWKGDFNGQSLPAGTYFYQVVLETGEVRTGYLEIMY